MSNGRFGIIEAGKKACHFAARHRGYLLRIGFLPLCMQAITALLLQTYVPHASIIEVYVCSFPSNLVFAWFLFVQTRLLLLDERLDRLPPDPAYLAARRYAMNLAVVVLLLFNLAVTAAGAFIEWVTRTGEGASAPASIAVAVLLAFLLWGLRFSVAHILAAVGYPLGRFLKKVRGMEFPARLMAMGLLFALPVYIMMAVMLQTLLPEDNLTQIQTVAVVALSAPVALLVPVLLNAAAAFALKEVLGRGTASP
jgi:hypothetical protein